MNEMYFRGMHFRRKENEEGRSCYNGVYIDLFDRLHYCAGRSFTQNRTSHRLGLVWSEKIGHLHSNTNQK